MIRTVLLCLCFCLLTNIVVYALTVGEQQAADSKFTVRDELTWLRNRDVKGIDTARIKSEQYIVTFGYKPQNSLTIFGKAGMANMELHRFEGETHFFSARFAYGVGAAYEITDSPVKVDLSCQYFTFGPCNGQLTGAAAIPAHQIPHEVEADWTEWQISLKIARELETFAIYGGPKYSRVISNQKRTWPSGETKEETFKSQEDFGLFTGISMDFNPGFSGFFEIRFVDETAYTLGIGYRF